MAGSRGANETEGLARVLFRQSQALIRTKTSGDAGAETIGEWQWQHEFARSSGALLYTRLRRQKWAPLPRSLRFNCKANCRLLQLYAFSTASTWRTGAH
jgi:hypothetical protein